MERLYSKVKVSPRMIEAGVDALLSSFSDEYLSWRAPGTDQAVERVFRAMLEASSHKNCEISEAV